MLFRSLKTPVIFFFSAAGVYAAVAYTTGNFSRRVGVLLLGVFAAYMLATVRQIRRAASAPAEGEAAAGARPSAGTWACWRRGRC